jgi:hypothetical protein
MHIGRRLSVGRYRPGDARRWERAAGEGVTGGRLVAGRNAGRPAVGGRRRRDTCPTPNDVSDVRQSAGTAPPCPTVALPHFRAPIDRGWPTNAARHCASTVCGGGPGWGCRRSRRPRGQLVSLQVSHWRGACAPRVGPPRRARGPRSTRGCRVLPTRARRRPAPAPATGLGPDRDTRRLRAAVRGRFADKMRRSGEIGRHIEVSSGYPTCVSTRDHGGSVCRRTVVRTGRRRGLIAERN